MTGIFDDCIIILLYFLFLGKFCFPIESAEFFLGFGRPVTLNSRPKSLSSCVWICKTSSFTRNFYSIWNVINLVKYLVLRNSIRIQIDLAPLGCALSWMNRRKNIDKELFSKGTWYLYELVIFHWTQMSDMSSIVVEQSSALCPQYIYCLTQRSCPKRRAPPWVDRVYDRKSVPGFFAIWTTQFWHFMESASTQRGAHLLLSSTQRFLGVPTSDFSSTQRFLGGAHLWLFINPSFLEGCPPLTFHQNAKFV